MALRHFIDRFGATASLLCALHCALLPLLLALLPAMGLGFLADHRFERAFVVFSVSLALLSLGFGFRRHRRLAAFLFMAPGVVLLAIGSVIDPEHTGSMHAILVSLGGFLIVAAHVSNLRLAHGHDHGDGCRCGLPTAQ